jgi:hypothetical protein
MVMKVVSMMAVAPSFLYRYYPSHVESNNSLWDQRQRGARKSNSGSGRPEATKIGRVQLHNDRQRTVVNVRIRLARAVSPRSSNGEAQGPAGSTSCNLAHGV